MQYFLAAAQEQNITRASQMLHITQPTLSRQLMQLEDELGVKLFERGNHSVTLTTDGFLLKRRAQEILSLVEKTKKELSAEEEVVGDLEIGSGEFMSFSFLAEILAAFEKKYPKVCPKLQSGNADTVKEQLENGSLDIGMLSYPVDIGKYEFVRLPQKEVWGAMVHKDFALAQKSAVTPEDLTDLPLIMPQRKLVREELKSWFGSLYDRISVFAYHNLLYNAAIMAKNKMGVVLTLRLESKFEDLKFVPLEPKLEFGLVMVWKKNQALSAPAAAFIDFAKQYIKGMTDDSK